MYFATLITMSLGIAAPADFISLTKLNFISLTKLITFLSISSGSSYYSHRVFTRHRFKVVFIAKLVLVLQFDKSMNGELRNVIPICS